MLFVPHHSQSLSLPHSLCNSFSSLELSSTAAQAPPPFPTPLSHRLLSSPHSQTLHRLPPGTPSSPPRSSLLSFPAQRAKVSHLHRRAQASTYRLAFPTRPPLRPAPLTSAATSSSPFSSSILLVSFFVRSPFPVDLVPSSPAPSPTTGPSPLASSPISDVALCSTVAAHPVGLRISVIPDLLLLLSLDATPPRLRLSLSPLPSLVTTACISPVPPPWSPCATSSTSFSLATTLPCSSKSPPLKFSPSH